MDNIWSIIKCDSFLGGNYSHDQCQSDEQMSQQSGQSILYNPQAQCVTNSTLPSSTIKSSASGGSTNQNNTINGSNCLLSSKTSSSGNIINHHYEDLQMNPITGNLVPTSIIINNDNSVQSNNGGTSSASTGTNSIYPKTFRHVEGNNDVIDLTAQKESNIIMTGGKENGQEGRTNMPGIVLNGLSESLSTNTGGLTRTIGLTAINNNNNNNSHLKQSSFRSSSSSATNKAANLMRNSFKKAMGKT